MLIDFLWPLPSSYIHFIMNNSNLGLFGMLAFLVNSLWKGWTDWKNFSVFPLLSGAKLSNAFFQTSFIVCLHLLCLPDLACLMAVAIRLRVPLNLVAIYIGKSLTRSIQPWSFYIVGFPGSSSDKESTCNAKDPGLIPKLGRSPGERIGYALQYSWASLMAQKVKNLPAMQ